MPPQTENLLATPDPIRELPIAPRRVVSGPGAVAQVGAIARSLGHQALIVGGLHSYPAVQDPLEASLAAAGVRFVATRYGQDCCEPELDRMLAIARVESCSLVIGTGGGKALDAAKLVAHRAGLPVITVPTSAATCAAWTALSNVYSPSGTWLYGVPLPTGPDAIVVDHALIAAAPPRLLASGIADALAKWVESSASVDPLAADAMTLAALEMARFIYERLISVGPTAYEQALRAEPGHELCQAIDCAVQLAGTVGGLGGSRCRSVAAHAVANALTTMPGHQNAWHGEKVAFGILVQRLMQGFSLAAVSELARYFAALGLNVSLRGQGVREDEQAIALIAQSTVRPESSVHLLPGRVDAPRVASALAQANDLARAALHPPVSPL
jgi:glycerol dehydrogenase